MTPTDADILEPFLDFIVTKHGMSTLPQRHALFTGSRNRRSDDNLELAQGFFLQCWSLMEFPLAWVIFG